MNSFYLDGNFYRSLLNSRQCFSDGALFYLSVKFRQKIYQMAFLMNNAGLLLATLVGGV